VISEAKAAICDSYIAGRNVMVVGDGDFSFSKEITVWAASKSAAGVFCTSVLPSADEVIKRYFANNSAIKDNLAWFSCVGIQHGFGVDATRLGETACWDHVEPCDVIMWNYPFPEDNDTSLATKQALIAAFFQSAKSWSSFSSSGIVVIGLKSCSKTKRHSTTDKDYQFRQWGVEDAAAAHDFQLVSTVGPVVPFWHATHVSGRPLCKAKEIAAGHVAIKYYAFQNVPPSANALQ